MPPQTRSSFDVESTPPANTLTAAEKGKRSESLMRIVPDVKFDGKAESWAHFKSMFSLAANTYRLGPYLFNDDPKSVLGDEFDPWYAEDAKLLLVKHLE